MGSSISSPRVNVVEPEFSVTLHRIEVHAGPSARDGDELVWELTAGPGVEDGVVLWGYLRRSESDGPFAQTQVVGFTSPWKWSDISSGTENHGPFNEWVARYAAESMFDTARRAIQAQAALMDTRFEIDLKAPPATVEFGAFTDVL